MGSSSVTAGVPVVALRGISRRRRMEITWGFIFVAPVVLGILTFMAFPMLYGIYISFFKWSIIGKNPSFILFGNYVRLFGDPLFLKALKNTVTYVAGVLAFSVTLSLLLAVLFNREMPFVETLKVAYYLPVVTMMVAIAMVWRWVLSTEYGLLNYFLSLIGLKKISWLTDPGWAMPGLIVMSVWKGVGFNMVLFLAGLKNIPMMYYEAADIDGAKAFRKFVRITLPLLSPTTFFVLLTTIIHSFQIFEQALILFSGPGSGAESTGAGPDNACNTLVLYLYNNAFKWQEAGYGTAQAFFLFIILIVFTIIQMQLQKRWVHYE